MPTGIRTLHINTERTFRGGERQVLLLMRGLVERGHPAELVAQPAGELAQRAEAAGLTVHRIRVRCEADPIAFACLCSRLRDADPDIVHLHDAHAHTLGVAAAVLTGRGRRVVSRRVVSPVGVNLFSRLKYRRGVDRYVAISEAVKAKLLEAGVAPDRVAVVHSCVEPARFETAADRSDALRKEFGIPDGAPVVGTVGAMCPAKGFAHFLRAIPQVLEQAPAARFVLVGDGELRGDLEREAAGLGLAPGALTFAGWRRDVPELLRFFDLFVSSSVEEGLGTSVLQALASRTPVVVTDAGGLPEVVEHGESGLVVRRGDPGALAGGIVALLNDAGRRATMAAAGYRRVADRFTPAKMVEATVAVYRDVLGGGPEGAR